MDGGRRGRWGLLGRGDRGRGHRRTGRRIPAERRGFWVSLRGQNQGAVVVEGVDFAQDSDEGGGDDFLFVSDDSESEEEVNDDSNDGSLVVQSEDLCAGNAPTSPALDKSCDSVPLYTQQQSSVVCSPITAALQSDGMKGVVCQDIAGHSQPPEEEDPYMEHPELQEQDTSADDAGREFDQHITKQKCANNRSVTRLL
ncbi:unnamed protein product [Urochloa humidicola]